MLTPIIGGNIMRGLTLLLCMCILALPVDAVSVCKVKKPGRAIMLSWSDDVFVNPALLDAGVRDLYTSAQTDTYCLVWYDFEMMDWQGWTQVDNTAQVDTFSHVDDFIGVAPGERDGLLPIEGTQSMWCGARDWDHQIIGCPGDYEYLCSWVCAPGYGNGWNQMLQTDDFEFHGLLTFSYRGYFDSEPDYDQTYVEYDAGAGNWIEIDRYDGTVDVVASHELALGQVRTKLRFHFISDGTCSDQDGLWSSDGAFIVDSITIKKEVLGEVSIIDFENFETYTVCIKDTRGAGGLWWGNIGDPFGINSGLTPNLADKDPCRDNFGTQIVFFFSPWLYPSPDYPGLFETPYCTGPGGIEAPCQNEIVISPPIDMEKYSSQCDENQDTDIPGGDLEVLGGAYLRFTVYRDLPWQNLVFYIWGIRNIPQTTGCPGPWLDRNYVYYGPDQDYIFSAFDVSDLCGYDDDGDGHTDDIQIAVGIEDLLGEWYLTYPPSNKHTPAPWFDNIRFYRFKAIGPQWSWRDLDIFQDNFPEVGLNLESYIRADAANDLRPNDDPVIDPGDSAVVTCTSPLGEGIDTTGDGEPMVYCHVWPEYVGPMVPPHGPKSDLFGPSLEGTYGRYDSDDGSQWTILQCEYARTCTGISPDRYAVDLNDSLFTRGYVVHFYFKAYDMAGETTTLPSNADEGVWFEWTCLPTMSSDILFVDDFHGRGTLAGQVEQYWDPCFEAVVPDVNQPDRYDVNNPSSAVSNGPGSRAKNYHLTTAYSKIIWDSGNLGFCTISEGDADYSDKSNDAQMLVDWMDFSEHDVGLWVCGDDIAEDLAGSPSAVALQLPTTYCGVSFVGGDYHDLSGIVSPKVWATPGVGNPLWHGTWGDSFYVFGGCPIINQFDYLEKTGDADYALSYPDVGGLPYYAGIYNTGINNAGYDIKTMWFGFSFMYERECEVTVPMMRFQVVRDVILWMENDVNADITEVDDIPAVNALSQNFPNPFNPITTIKFGLRVRGHVSIKVFDVAGRLVKTLVDEVRDAGMYRVTWDGTNNNQAKVASGVFFYRMKTAEYEQTRKMVILR